jgi:hypothetical protein
VTRRTAPRDLLDRVYEDLDFVTGPLMSPTQKPRSDDPEGWRGQGEWLMCAERMGAERVFFVGDDPVLLFVRLPGGADETAILDVYRKAWSLARPRCLFLAAGDELRVYALSEPPTRAVGTPESPQPLEVLEQAANVAEQLARFHRDQVESGVTFEGTEFANRGGRADSHLLNDVRTVTDALVGHGLTPRLAHALIERVILVRYLEDRGVVTPEYFEGVAAKRRAWAATLAAPPPVPVLGAASTFAKCLGSKSFTYAVFRRLAEEFNGDLFVVGPDEAKSVSRAHLALLYRLLTTVGDDRQLPLFLWAYDFAVIPIDLISSMYEQFYRSAAPDDSGTHYTPPALVEFVLARALTSEVLSAGPRVCDPACGSGIFLVEAYRRIVRHEMTRRRRRLSRQELRRLLLTRIAGVDINEEAIQLAAFSLYLAYLNYQTPQDIRDAGPLPRLIHRSNTDSSVSVLVVANAFSSMTIQAIGTGDGRDRRLPWPGNTFDVVVGNPPWSEPTEARSTLGEDWARGNGLAIGDRNPSHLFMWRALSFVRATGSVALLVAAGALHNVRPTSRRFRQEWLASVHVEEVVNFTPARQLFFEGAIAPFMLVKFRPRGEDPGVPEDQVFMYRTVRPSLALKNTGLLGLARVDRRWVRQASVAERDYLWKTYAWGSHHDDAFMARLDLEAPLREFLRGKADPGWGFQLGPNAPTPVLGRLKSLKTMEPWGPLKPDWFEDAPKGVKRQPDESLYRGQRIVVTRGIRAGFGPRARLERVPFSFRHTIYGIPLPKTSEWRAKCILGVLLSSFGRYRLFMTSGSWGVWHDSIVAEDLLEMPMRIGGRMTPATRAIVLAVDQLKKAKPGKVETDLFSGGEKKWTPAAALAALDQAVFDLFDLAPAERDLVTDFHRYVLPMTAGRRFGAPKGRIQVTGGARGTAASLSAHATLPVHDYLGAFLTAWNRELSTRGELAWRLVTSQGSDMLAAVFETRDVADSLTITPEPDLMRWQHVLTRLGRALSVPLSRSVLTDGVVRSVTETSIVVVKRNEERLWSASAAREDAEATILQAMALRAS